MSGGAPQFFELIDRPGSDEPAQPRFDFAVSLEPSPMTDCLAIVFHITDIHLDLSHRLKEYRQALFDFISQPVGAIATALAVALVRSRGKCAPEHAWRNLVRTMRRRVSERRTHGSVIVAQTGDVEAFGADRDGTHPGYTRLYEELWPHLHARGAKCVDIFGNHDIWPPMFLGADFEATHADQPLLLALEHSQLMGPWDEIRIVGVDAPDICVHRVCTVDASAWGAISAQGRICSEPVVPGDQPPERIGERLRERLADKEALHLVISHHPIHLVPDLTFGRQLISELEGRGEVLSAIEDTAFVFSGHLHQLHPGAGAAGSSPQMIGDSATIRSRSTSSPSIAEYEIRRREEGQPSSDRAISERMRADRIVHIYSPMQGYVASPTEEDVVPV